MRHRGIHYDITVACRYELYLPKCISKHLVSYPARPLPVFQLMFFRNWEWPGYGAKAQYLFIITTDVFSDLQYARDVAMDDHYCLHWATESKQLRILSCTSVYHSQHGMAQFVVVVRGNMAALELFQKHHTLSNDLLCLL